MDHKKSAQVQILQHVKSSYRLPTTSREQLEQEDYRHTNVQIGRETKQTQDDSKEINKTQFGYIEGKAEQAKKELEDCQSELQRDPTNIRLITKEVRLAKNYKNETWQGISISSRNAKSSG